MTYEQLLQLSTDPKRFLRQCLYHEQQIALYQEQIQHYRDIATSITQEIKEITTFSLTPSCKVESCVVEITELEDKIKEQAKELYEDLESVKTAIDYSEDSQTRAILQARYLNNMTWEEIAVHFDLSYRWVLRLHGKALTEISEKAKLFLEKPC